MDKEIKRLLRLKSIPGFKISPREEQLLEDWKNAQKILEIKPAPKKRKYTRKKKTTNEVKPEIKETGRIEVEDVTPEVENISMTTVWSES